MSRRFAVTCVAATLSIAFACFDPPGVAGPLGTSTTRPIVVGVGDSVRVKGTAVGCAVAKRKGVTTIECLTTVRRVGTYGTLMSDKDVLVVRFKTPSVAQAIFTTTQRSTRFTICR